MACSRCLTAHLVQNHQTLKPPPKSRFPRPSSRPKPAPKPRVPSPHPLFSDTALSLVHLQIASLGPLCFKISLFELFGMGKAFQLLNWASLLALALNCSLRAPNEITCGAPCCLLSQVPLPTLPHSRWTYTSDCFA